MNFFFRLLFLTASITSILHLASVAQFLPSDEVLILQSISSKIKNRFWKVDQNFCSGISPSNPGGGVGLNNVTCDCSFNNNSLCHVTHIQMKSLNLGGILPAEIGNLSFLQEIDFSRNYISGSIPRDLANAPITILSLMANRIRGSIPQELGEFSTLEDLNLEDNLLGGPLPQSIGNLLLLKRLLLSANNFTGSIPTSFGKLKNLTDFRIDGNAINGKIPDFIGNLTRLEKLYMQGTSMEGPIPSTFSSLVNLKELRITDLNGGRVMKFPDFSGSKKLTRLVLRNCFISDVIPEFISQLSNLKTLDLSFNMLTGSIPGRIRNMDLDHLFLTNNSLSGDIPDWVSNNKNNFDLSYNNFSGLIPLRCQMIDVNLISNIFPSERKEVPWCFMKGLPCSQDKHYHSLFVNCGGGRTEYEDNLYEEDYISSGISSFVSAGQKWAYSSTGIFMGNEDSGYLAVASNLTAFNDNDSKIYNTARLSPISLKYYGLCMLKGSYTVRLHFAEIMFSNDQTFNSLGRRIFDVSIQGKRVLKDFNIMEKAGGAYKKYVVIFNNVTVDDSTLEISLYWAGKGTNAIPERGVYGPSISAIEVTPNFEVRSEGLSVRAIVGIVVSSFVILSMILAVLIRRGYLRKKDLENKELRGIDLQTGYFTLRQIKAATGNFDPSKKIGEGGFGPVYQGVLSDGTVIAVKQLSSKSKQGNREFVNEIGMISALQHANLVRLYGCCIEGNQLLLVYEYMENNSLANALFKREGESGLSLDWGTRRKICMGIAKGLAYLHEESRLKIVHRDIKATNVLLDKDLNAKISDFGLAKLDDDGNTHISTRIAGTIGYMAPEYAMRGCLTYKADVYSFGIVMLEIVSGKSNTSYRPKEEFVYLLDWAYVLQEQGNLLELMDPELGEKVSTHEVLRMLHVALLCTNPSPTLRPAMSSVVKMLEGREAVQVPVIKGGPLLFRPRNGQPDLSSFSQESRGPWVDSSTSLPTKGGVRDEDRDMEEGEDGETSHSFSSSNMLFENVKR